MLVPPFVKDDPANHQSPGLTVQFGREQRPTEVTVQFGLMFAYAHGRISFDPEVLERHAPMREDRRRRSLDLFGGHTSRTTSISKISKLDERELLGPPTFLPLARRHRPTRANLHLIHRAQRDPPTSFGDGPAATTTGKACNGWRLVLQGPVSSLILIRRISPCFKTSLPSIMAIHIREGEEPNSASTNSLFG